MIRKTQLKAHLLLMLRTAEEQTALMQQLLGAVLPSLPAIFKYQFCGCSGRRRQGWRCLTSQVIHLLEQMPWQPCQGFSGTCMCFSMEFGEIHGAPCFVSHSSTRFSHFKLAPFKPVAAAAALWQISGHCLPS